MLFNTMDLTLTLILDIFYVQYYSPPPPPPPPPSNFIHFTCRIPVISLYLQSENIVDPDQLAHGPADLDLHVLKKKYIKVKRGKG